jgi:glutamate formiminotransferase/formiminotetrahydrofolate cyclodeaminase
MVANLSSHKRGWDEHWAEFSAVAERGKDCHVRLTRLVDEDTDAFNAIVAAWRADPAARPAAVQAATRRAIEVPLAVMETALAALEVAREMAESGMPASLSDAAVGALCARTAVRGAGFNVRINAKELTDDDLRRAFLERAAALEEAAARGEAAVLEVVQHAL